MASKATKYRRKFLKHFKAIPQVILIKQSCPEDTLENMTEIRTELDRAGLKALLQEYTRLRDGKPYQYFIKVTFQ